MTNQYELVEDVIFANTFFALEETGLAYPSLSPDATDETRKLDAWLRVFASASRVREGKYFDRNNFVTWDRPKAVPKNNRVRRFADKVFGTGLDNGLQEVLNALSAIGHTGGVVEVGKLHLRVAEAADPYWRCESCERVHLHRGEQICTRCYNSLPDNPTGVVDTLWSQNFLGRRIVRGHDQGIKRFRLKCEELTGQTEDFSDRLRRFKDIFVGQSNDIGRLAEEIDMLSVTTTMEVGIDIGSLQTVYQANMPPQRFNYQQRVGRAGRRGQAFSFVATFCRGRSHDAFYFRHPESITGDAPPPPFLAVDHDPIPHRLLRKVWLRAAFSVVRDDCIGRGEIYPGDDLVPPDVHGEYVPTGDFYAAGIAVARSIVGGSPPDAAGPRPLRGLRHPGSGAAGAFARGIDARKAARRDNGEEGCSAARQRWPRAISRRTGAAAHVRNAYSRAQSVSGDASNGRAARTRNCPGWQWIAISKWRSSNSRRAACS